MAAAQDRVPAGERITATDFRSLPGRGVRALVDGTEVTVGGPAMLSDLQLSVPADVTAVTDGWVRRGASVLHVAHGDRVLGAVALEDSPTGVAAATAAGLRVIGVPESPGVELPGADRVVASLNDLLPLDPA